jgi:two-component system sensor histidine kinase KdpD
MEIEKTGAPGSSPEQLLVFRQPGEDLASNQLQSGFLANLAHEFRTPLSSLAATIEFLTEEGSSLSQDDLAELSNTARLGVHHLQTLIDNLLESALIEANSFRLRCHPILLREVIRVAENIMSPLFKRRQQDLQIDEPQEFITILADPDRLCQAIVNLLDNASKYSPFGSTIQLSFKRQQAHLFCEVLDSGPGLSPDSLDDVFKRFVSLTDLQGARYGIGLGLPVVKTIIEAHGGQVGANNRPEGGARFWFTLPLKPR